MVERLENVSKVGLQDYLLVLSHSTSGGDIYYFFYYLTFIFFIPHEIKNEKFPMTT